MIRRQPFAATFPTKRYEPGSMVYRQYVHYPLPGTRYVTNIRHLDVLCTSSSRFRYVATRPTVRVAIYVFNQPYAQNYSATSVRKHGVRFSAHLKTPR